MFGLCVDNVWLMWWSSEGIYRFASVSLVCLAFRGFILMAVACRMESVDVRELLIFSVRSVLFDGVFIGHCTQLPMQLRNIIFVEIWRYARLRQFFFLLRFQCCQLQCWIPWHALIRNQNHSAEESFVGEFPMFHFWFVLFLLSYSYLIFEIVSKYIVCQNSVSLQLRMEISRVEESVCNRSCWIEQAKMIMTWGLCLVVGINASVRLVSIHQNCYF